MSFGLNDLTHPSEDHGIGIDFWKLPLIIHIYVYQIYVSLKSFHKFRHLALVFWILFRLCQARTFLFQIGKLVDTLTQQLENKGKEINEYREKHNIRVRGEEDKQDDKEKEKKPASSQGVLVAKDS